MPVLRSAFCPPPFLANGHVQTILPVLLPRRIAGVFTHERLELEDGDFLDLHWMRGGSDRLAILLHGLEGCVRQRYIRGLAATLSAAGWDVLAWNFRGCGGTPNRLLRFYHSGETSDLAAIVAHAAPAYARMALAGFSLGGNVMLKYLGEAPPHPRVAAAAAISAPIDLASCAHALDSRRGNRLYLRRFLTTMTAKIAEKALRFPGELPRVPVATSFREFDGRYTAPLHGFRDADDYWTRSSSRQFLPRITVPTLLLNARNDPFLTSSCFPDDEAAANPHLHLEAPASGGHVGFLDLAAGLQPWHERRVTQFLTTHLTQAQ